jgi:hypothetical protein
MEVKIFFYDLDFENDNLKSYKGKKIFKFIFYKKKKNLIPISNFFFFIINNNFFFLTNII